MRNYAKKPRKAPIQVRSMELVGTIFEASVRILKSAGAAKFSTRNVAELAGISVGSLYQYFPNKDALIGALIEREAKRHVQLLEAKYSEMNNQTLAEVIEALVMEIIDAIRRDKVLLKTILSNTFVVDRLDSIIEAREHLVNFVEKVLDQSGSHLNLPNSKAMAYVIVAALGGVVETLIFRKTEPISDIDLAHEISAMVCAYIRSKSPSP